MSDYIIHNIGLTVLPRLDFNNLVDPDKPVLSFPNYYLGKLIGAKGTELELQRTRRGGGEEHVPNCVLRNDGGIALIRIHNRENLTIYDLPESTGDEVEDCVGVPQQSYPFAYAVVDYRDGRCQLAIEKSTSWDSKTNTIRICLENFFNEKLSRSMGIETILKEKPVKTTFEEFIDQRTIDHGDVIESFTFEYVNLKLHPTARIPESMQEEMDRFSKNLEVYNALSATTTMKMGSVVDNEKLKQLSTVVTLCTDNAFDLVVKFRDYGDYDCNKGIPAKYPMNDVVISHFKNFEIPDIVTSDFDLPTWLDEVFVKVIEGKDDKKIPTKPS